MQLVNGSIAYTPPAVFVGLDYFSYVLSPSSGPAINGVVNVLVDAFNGNGSFIMGATVNEGQTTIQFIGIPGTLYDIQASTDLRHWTVIGSVTAGSNGLFQFQDGDAGHYSQRYYRTSLQ